MSVTNTNQTTLVGWQSEPNKRGSYAILQSCLGTTALLCWSSVCPNVPPLGSGTWRKIGGKLSLFLLSILMPEAVLFLALGQLHRAWLDRQAFKKQGFYDWGLRECFFVNMGGLFIQFLPEEAGLTQPHPFPINCKQLRHLNELEFLDIPNITPEQIEMRNKSNGLARTITIIQVLWFTTTTLTRIAQGLPITTLELTTLSLVLIMIFSAAAWWRKPMDIEYPVIISCDTILSAALAKIKDPPNRQSRNFGATPLSFYDRHEWAITRAWTSYTNILRVLCGGANPSATKNELAPNFPNAFPSIELQQMAVTLELSSAILTQVYSCVLLYAWNADFPTPTERLLWRISAVVGVSFGVVGCTIAGIDLYGEWILGCFQSLWLQLRKLTSGTKTETEIPLVEGRRVPKTRRATSWWNKLCSGPHWLRRLANLSPDRDPNLDMRLRVWIPATLTCMLYCFARAYIIVEDIISLRRQPHRIYDVVDWGQYSVLF